jgi:hypothetical protein
MANILQKSQYRVKLAGKQLKLFSYLTFATKAILKELIKQSLVISPKLLTSSKTLNRPDQAKFRKRIVNLKRRYVLQTEQK